MGYKTHNFLAGAKLSAQSLNEMDEQIKENTDGVALFTMETIVEQIKKLSLTTDGEYIYLYFDSTLINEVVSYRITCNNGNQRTLRNP